VPESSRSTRGSGSGADAEHNSGRKRYKGQERGGPSQGSCGKTGNNRGGGRVHGVHEPETVKNEVASQNIADYAGGKCDNEL
jgi:hypothetical protein